VNVSHKSSEKSLSQFLYFALIFFLLSFRLLCTLFFNNEFSQSHLCMYLKTLLSQTTLKSDVLRVVCDRDFFFFTVSLES
jgi:hypothetical protein